MLSKKTSQCAIVFALVFQVVCVNQVSALEGGMRPAPTAGKIRYERRMASSQNPANLIPGSAKQKRVLAGQRLTRIQSERSARRVARHNQKVLEKTKSEVKEARFQSRFSRFASTLLGVGALDALAMAFIAQHDYHSTGGAVFYTAFALSVGLASRVFWKNADAHREVVKTKSTWLQSQHAANTVQRP